LLTTFTHSQEIDPTGRLGRKSTY